MQEERAPLLPIVNASFPVLLGLLQQLVANSSSTQQVAEFMKLICKVSSCLCLLWLCCHLLLPWAQAPEASTAAPCVRLWRVRHT